MYGTVGFIVVSTLCACSSTRKAPSGLGAPTDPRITTPSFYNTYYSTQKARQLGETYGNNLDRLVDRVLQSSIGRQQFANSVVSISLGFFTYSTSRPPDERYLEALLGMPDILDATEDPSGQLDKLFSQYGRELLSILSQDKVIVEDPKVAGYGLNFSWRSVRQTPSGPRLSLDGGVIYVRKDKTQRFLNRQIEQDELLATSILFARQGDQSARQIRYSAASLPVDAPATVPVAPVVRASPSITPSPDDALPKEDLSTKEPPDIIALSTPTLIPIAPVDSPPPASTPSPADESRKEGLFAKKPPPIPATPPVPVDHDNTSSAAQEPQLTPTTPTKSTEAMPPPSQQLSSDPEQLFDSQINEQNQPIAVAPQASLSSHLPSGQEADGRYLVLLSFAELLEALRWSHALGNDGYTVTRDFARESQEIRLRVGSFRSFNDAERFLKDVKSQGANGQVLQIKE
jgi:hypothetical protein